MADSSVLDTPWVSHLQDFVALIAQHEAQGGVFIHTGRTPPGVYHKLQAANKITLISGRKLVDLIQGKPLTLWTDPIV